MDLATLTGQLRALASEALPRIDAAPDLAALDELKEERPFGQGTAAQRDLGDIEACPAQPPVAQAGVGSVPFRPGSSFEGPSPSREGRGCA